MPRKHEEPDDLSSSLRKLKITNSRASLSSATIPGPLDAAYPLCSHRGRSKPCSLVSLCLGVFGQHLEDILPEICEIAPILPSHIKHAIVAIARRRKLLQDDCLIALADHTWNVLDISGSDVTNAGIAKVSKICTNLRAVDISLCDRVTEEAVCCLIRHCHSLETLRCGGSPASHFTAKCSLKYLLPTLQKVEEDHWEELDNREIISGAPSLRWLVWPKIDDQCRKILSTDCPRISINPKPSLISHRGSEIPWEAFPDIVLDDPIVEDLDPKTWSLASNGASRIRSQATSGTFELPIAEKFRLAFEERDARLAPKRAKNVRQHKRRAEKERLMSNVNAKSFLLASKAKNFLWFR